MSHNSDVVTRNKLYDANKAKARALLDNIENGFKHWHIIRNWIDFGHPTTVSEDHTQLNALLGSIYVEIHEPEPFEKRLSCNLSDPSRIAFKPTEKGIIAYYWFTKYNEQCRKTSEAYELGKKGAVLQVFNKIVKSLDMDFGELCADVADNQKGI